MNNRRDKGEPVLSTPADTCYTLALDPATGKKTTA